LTTPWRVCDGMGRPRGSKNKRVTARPPVHPSQRLTIQGNNQHRRVLLDTFFAAQRARFEAALDRHLTRVRERLREYEEDSIFERREATGSHRG
jgi:hypothetical protein